MQKCARTLRRHENRPSPLTPRGVKNELITIQITEARIDSTRGRATKRRALSARLFQLARGYLRLIKVPHGGGKCMRVVAFFLGADPPAKAIVPVN